MKCPKYDPDYYGCMSPFVFGRCPHPEGRCRLGWLPFWTPVERAGIKAMGNALKSFIKSKNYSYSLKKKSGFVGWKIWRLRDHRCGSCYAAKHMIRAFVSAARETKEEK